MESHYYLLFATYYLPILYWLFNTYPDSLFTIYYFLFPPYCWLVAAHTYSLSTCRCPCTTFYYLPLATSDSPWLVATLYLARTVLPSRYSVLLCPYYLPLSAFCWLLLFFCFLSVLTMRDFPSVRDSSVLTTSCLFIAYCSTFELLHGACPWLFEQFPFCFFLLIFAYFIPTVDSVC